MSVEWSGFDSFACGPRPVRSTNESENEEGPAWMQVPVHAAVIWPMTGVKVQPVPFMTIERARFTSTVSLVVAPERISNGVTAFTSPEGTLNTTFVPIGVTIFPAKYISLKLLGTHVIQAGRLLYQPGFDSVQIDRSFWLADFSAEYRIPGRRAIISIGASNLFNRDLTGYQEIDPANPDFSRGRLLFARALLQL